MDDHRCKEPPPFPLDDVRGKFSAKLNQRLGIGAAPIKLHQDEHSYLYRNEYICKEWFMHFEILSAQP